MSFLRSLVNSSGSTWMRVGEAADAGLVGRQQPLDELLGARRDEVEALLHAAAAIEHHDHGDGLRFGRKEGQRLELAVVVDLEVVLGEVGHQPARGVGDGGVDRDRARAAPERGLLLAGSRGAQRDDARWRARDIGIEGRHLSAYNRGAHRDIPLVRNESWRSRRAPRLGMAGSPIVAYRGARASTPVADPSSSTGRGSRADRSSGPALHGHAGHGQDDRHRHLDGLDAALPLDVGPLVGRVRPAAGPAAADRHGWNPHVHRRRSNPCC